MSTLFYLQINEMFFISEDRHIETRSTNNNSYQYGLENPRQEHLRHQQGHGHRREKELSYTRGDDPQMQPCYGNEVVKDTGYKNNNFHKYGSKTGKCRIFIDNNKLGLTKSVIG